MLEQSKLDIFYSKLGYTFKDIELLKSAIYHSSMGKKYTEFDRLEFLGDRVLGLALADIIFKNRKYEDEGKMMQIFANCACCDTCAKIAKSIGLHQILYTARSTLRDNKSVLGDAMEAVLGAVFLDSDFCYVKDIVMRLWSKKLESGIKQDSKSVLNELVQKMSMTTPIYEVTDILGDAHQQTFVVKVSGLGHSTVAKGANKKDAQMKAASKLLNILKNKYNS